MKQAPQGDWVLGSSFNETYKHHDSIKDLWETKWRFPHNINDGYSDAYTEAFFPTCDALIEKAKAAFASNNHAEASSLYFRIAALYRISRFPFINSPVKRQAFEAQKSAYLSATSHWIDPVVEEVIPHTFATNEDGKIIPLYVRVPITATPKIPAPTILLITGLDGYRPDNTQRTQEFLARGWATVIAEIPGTADCPADPKDPRSPERLWDSIFKWMVEKGVFDMKNVVAWGLSCGGYYAVRIAHTHAKRLRGSVAQGAGVHHFFDEGWLRKVDGHEYPFDLTPALAQKFGYDSVEELYKKAQDDFSLVSTGIVEKPSTRLLLVNGTKDGLMPLEDSLILMNYGSPKEAR
ncbi:MAG: hypothetical protein Q9209_000252 [Squamulea sp. 1 TL-2023]